MSAFLREHKEWFYGVALILVVGVFLWGLFGISVEFFLVERLSAARATWEEKSGGSYRAVVQPVGYGPLTDGGRNFIEISLVVDQGEVVGAADRPGLYAASDPDYPFDTGSFMILTWGISSHFTLTIAGAVYS
jgi:hypothetical protein